MYGTYAVDKRLGQGAFGLVLQVISGSSGESYAAKVSTGDGKMAIVSEADIQSRLIHPNILQFITSFDIHHCPQNPILPLPNGVTGDCGVILLELCSGGSLENILDRYKILTLDQLRMLTKQIGSGLLYLKEQGIIHRDIKPANILFCGGDAKIGDFGVSKFAEDRNRDLPGTGTPNFMAFESYTGEYSFATDVYAFGVTLYLAYIGKLPFDMPDLNNIRKSYDDRKVWFRKKDKHDDFKNVETLILSMLKTDQARRIEIKKLMTHPFVSTINVEMDDSDDDDDAIADKFKRWKSDFGQGSREQFYYYLANRHPSSRMMSMKLFTELWDQL